MIKSRLFLRFAVLGAVISIVFMSLALITTRWIRELTFDEPFREGGPFIATESLLSSIPPEHRVESLKAMEQKTHGGNLVHMFLSGADGKLIYPENATPEMQEKFQRKLELFMQHTEGARKSGARLGALPQPPPGDNGSMPPMGPPPDFPDLVQLRRGGGPPIRIARLSGQPAQYLMSVLSKPPPLRVGPFIIINLIQVASIISAVVVTLLALAYSFRSRARLAEEVIRELSTGNLKARFPITKMDEIGQMMFSFNKMADEIERLVENLQKVETVRRDLLRELAHDLRTPIASMKSLIETLTEKGDALKSEKKTELLKLAMSEADYFEELVDSLLFLGKVAEPKYQTNAQNFDVLELIDNEIETSRHRYQKISFALDVQRQEIPFYGDPGLLKRLVRNALENASSFAKSRVKVTALITENRVIEIIVEDDGPGFDSESLKLFGQRRYSRQVKEGSSRRISIGLGSVIMKSVTDAYRGQLIASNKLDPQSGDIRGASVLIRIPQP